MRYCDPALERVAQGGVAAGCPSVDLQQTAVTLWTAVGHTAETMRLTGEVAQLPYNRRVGGRFRDAEAAGVSEAHLAPD